MKTKAFLGTVSLAVLSACVTAGAPETVASAKPLLTEADFRAAIVGRTLSFKGSELTINADSTVTGPWTGEPITGTWYWEDQYWCREVAIGGVDRGLDCQTWVIEGATATFTRDRGNGESNTYDIL